MCSMNNGRVLENEKPEYLDECIKKIKSFKPDVVAISLVYNSQVFYTHALIDALDIPVIVGGPAVSEKLKTKATYLKNELELLSHIGGTAKNFNTIPEFQTGYFTPKPVIPIKTSYSCNYRKCTFCTHHANVPYLEIPLDNLEQTINKSKAKHFFFIDDMMPKDRLLEIAKILKPLDVYWTCQLRPTSDLDKSTLQILYQGGLRMVCWGAESGCNRILKLIQKGTTKESASEVINNAHIVGIKNVLYVIFGFPSETKEEFRETIQFLKNVDVDLISTSIFGLQQGSIIFNNPEKYGITKIIKEKRTLLSPKIAYEVLSGMTQKEAKKLQSKYQKTLDSINKYPRKMNIFREHMLILCSDTQ